RCVVFLPHLFVELRTTPMCERLFSDFAGSAAAAGVYFTRTIVCWFARTSILRFQLLPSLAVIAMTTYESWLATLNTAGTVSVRSPIVTLKPSGSTTRMLADCEYLNSCVCDHSSA